MAEGIYESSWINGNHKYRTSVQIIMTRAQKIQVLTGLSFLDANLETFAWVKETIFFTIKFTSIYTFIFNRSLMPYIRITQYLSLCMNLK